MNELDIPESTVELVKRLAELHGERKKLPRPPRRTSLTREERKIVIGKTGGLCHLCGGEITEKKFAADHVLAHAAGGKHALDNYLPAHSLCNGCRWFYSAEEFQWILRIGVWGRKQMEDRTKIGLELLASFLQHEKAVRKRRKPRP